MSSWTPTIRQTGRYGTGAAMAAAESVFAADSTAVLSQLTHTSARSGAVSDPQAVTAASLVDMAAAFVGGTGSGMRWLVDHITRDSAPASARTVYDQAIRLANPNDDWAALRETPGGEQITEAWVDRRMALVAYRNQLTAAGEIEPGSVLPSLLHLHHVRMAGIDPESERVCRRLARAAALSWTVRTAGTTS